MAISAPFQITPRNILQSSLDRADIGQWAILFVVVTTYSQPKTPQFALGGY